MLSKSSLSLLKAASFNRGKRSLASFYGGLERVDRSSMPLPYPRLGKRGGGQLMMTGATDDGSMETMIPMARIGRSGDQIDFDKRSSSDNVYYGGLPMARIGRAASEVMIPMARIGKREPELDSRSYHIPMPRIG